MNKCIIFGSCDINNYDYIDIKPNDFIICADGGYKHTKNLNISPNLLVGDFDSYDINKVNNQDKILQFNCDKDDTDAFIAIKKGLQRGYKKFILYGCNGGRIDHQFANIQLLNYLIKYDAFGELIDINNRVFLLNSDSPFNRISVNEQYKNFYISIFSYTEFCKVTITGFKYNLTEYVLDNTTPLGISNELCSKLGFIKVINGSVLVIIHNLI